MSPPIAQRTFAGGEITSAAFARSDLALYEKSARALRNMICMKHGGVVGRPGTEYVGTALNGGNQVRLIPFIFNETGLGQSYVLEFGNQYIAFYQNGGNVIISSKTISGITQASMGVVTATGHGFSNGDIITIDGILGMTQLDNGYFIVQNVTTNTFTLTDLLGNTINTSGYGAYVSGGTADKIYIISSPYLQADLQNILYDQCADIVTLTNQNYPIMELARLGVTNWTLTRPSFGAPLAGPGVSMSGTNGSGASLYLVSAVNALGEESDNSNIGGDSDIFLAKASLTTPITLDWSASPTAGAIYYKVYAALSNAPMQYGYIGQTSATSFVDTGIVPDFTNTYPLRQVTAIAGPGGKGTVKTLFGQAGDYPASVGFCQQRRYFANTINNPIGFWGSVPGDFYNFDTHIVANDSDGIFAALFGSEINAIQHILELKFMLMLTSGAEIYVQGNGSGVVTPSAINASTQSQYGSSALRPLKVSDVLIFQQSLGSFMRDFAFDFAIDGYRGNDITIFAAHLFEGYQIVDWCYQKVPDSIIWAVRSDGKLLSCTYVREQQILAWAHHDFTNGYAENVVAIPENGEYAVYASIRRSSSAVVITSGVNDLFYLYGGAKATIPAGTYSLPNLVSTIQTALTAQIPGYSFTVTESNGVISFSSPDAFTLEWTLAIGGQSAVNLGATLGWTTPGEYGGIGSGPYIATAPNPITTTQSGTTQRSIERISSRLWIDSVNTPPVQQDPINAPFCDCSVQYDGRNTSSTTMTLQSGITIIAGVNDLLSFYQHNVATIPPGVYATGAALATVLQTALASALPSYSFTVAFTAGVFVFTSNASNFTFEWTLLNGQRAINTGATLGWPVAGEYGATGTGPWVGTAPSAPVFSTFITGNTAYTQPLLLVASAPFFNSAMVGDQIFLQDALWISSQGQKGNQIKCTIQAYTDSTHVTITPDAVVPAEFQGIAITTWAHAVKTISGLGFLEGQKVSIWADRYLVGSPLNSKVEPIYIVTGGSLTLDECYSVIYVGLPMTQDIETLDLETYFGATLLGKRKRTGGLRGYLYQTRNFYAGSENPDTNNQNTTGDPLFQLNSLKLGITTSRYNEAPPLVTQQDYVLTTARWNKSGGIFIRNVDPVPFGLLAISPNSEISEQTPYYRA